MKTQIDTHAVEIERDMSCYSLRYIVTIDGEYIGDSLKLRHEALDDVKALLRSGSSTQFDTSMFYDDPFKLSTGRRNAQAARIAESTKIDAFTLGYIECAL